MTKTPLQVNYSPRDHSSVGTDNALLYAATFEPQTPHLFTL